VLVAGVPATKASLETDPADIALVEDSSLHYVSRAAHKLAGALDECAPLGLTVLGRDALDAGASTGGFTQVLLERGARHVMALDVGHGQLAPEIAADPRVTAVEGANVRDLTAESAGAGVSLVVADLSFISLTLAVAPLVSFAADSADFLLMVKPQFEVGRAVLGKGGVVKDVSAKVEAVRRVVVHMQDNGIGIHAVARSALPGPAGNEEFFVWGSSSWQARGASGPLALDGSSIEEAIVSAVKGNS
jgi:23S rRNA (cytidine1920-2'-O)/16S rRNA (cytidine1409-2'-O)-methyltransferase